MGIMEHLVDDDAVRLVGQRQRVHVALAQARGDPRRLKLDPRQPQHFGRAVDADRQTRAGAEQFDHSPGPVPTSTSRPSGAAKRAADRPLDFALGDMERTDLSHTSAWAVNSGWRPRPVRRGRSRCGRHRSEHRRGQLVGPARRPTRTSARCAPARPRSGTPSCLPCAAPERRRRRDLQVARDARLALAEDLRKFTHRQFHDPQQARMLSRVGSARPGSGQQGERSTVTK